MNNLFILFLNTLLVGSVHAESGAGEAGAGADRAERNTWNAPSYNGGSFINTSLWSGKTENISANSDLLKKDIFKPQLEVNTNRGTLLANFNISLPPNFVGFTNLKFSYNHRQSLNLGYGIGWRMNLPKIDGPINSMGQTVYNVQDVVGAGEFISTNCPTIDFDIANTGIENLNASTEQRLCFKALMQETPTVLIKLGNKGFVLHTYSKINYLFSSNGELKIIYNGRGEKLNFKWDHGKLLEVRASSLSWKTKFNYLSSQDFPVSVQGRLETLPLGLKNISISKPGHHSIIDFNYSGQYLTKVIRQNSQKALFKGAYKQVDSEVSSVNLTAIDEKSNFILNKDLSTPIEVKYEKDDKKDAVIYLDLNGDSRQEKIILKTKDLFKRISAHFKSISYSVKGKTAKNCSASPEISATALQARLNKEKVSLDIYWAQVKSGKFEYIKDNSISNINMKLFKFKVSTHKKSSSDCDEIYYFDLETSHPKPIVIDTDFNGHNDIMWCSTKFLKNKEETKNQISELVKSIDKDNYRTGTPSRVLQLSLDTAKLKTKSLEHNPEDINVINNIRKWSISKGINCNETTLNIDWNEDGISDLLTGSKLTIFSRSEKKTIPLKKGQLRTKFKFNSEHLEKEHLALVNTGNSFKVHTAKNSTRVKKGTIVINDNASKVYTAGSKTKLLTNYYSNFGGLFKIAYKNQDNTQIITSIEKRSMAKDLLNRKEYKYSGSMTDDFLGLFVGYSKTIVKIKSAAIKEDKLIERTFLKDKNTNIVLFNTRARLQGRKIQEITSAGNRKITHTYIWDGHNLEDKHFYVFTRKTLSQFSNEGVYEVLSKENYINLENHQGIDYVKNSSQEIYLERDMENRFKRNHIKTISYSNIFLPTGQIATMEKKLISKDLTEKITYEHNQFGDVINEITTKGTHSYHFDSKGRLDELINDKGAKTTINYKKNLVGSISVSQDDLTYEVERNHLFEKESKVTSLQGVFKYQYNSDYELKQVNKLINNTNILLFKKSGFNRATLPQYTLSQNDLDFEVTLNEFGHPIHAVTKTKAGKYKVILDNELLDGHIIKSTAPYYTDEKTKLTTDFIYNGFGETISKAIIGKKKTFIETKFNRGCIQNYTNGHFITETCRDSLGKTYFASELGRGGAFSWYANGELANFNDEIKWTMDEKNIINSVNYKDQFLDRLVDLNNHLIREGEKVIKSDSFNRVKTAQIGHADFSFQYSKNRLDSEKLFLNGKSESETNYKYLDGNMSNISSTHFHKSFTYDEYNRIKIETTKTGSDFITSKMSYQDGNLASISPYIKHIDYLANGSLSNVEFSNGLNLSIRNNIDLGKIASLIYKKDNKAVHSTRYRYNVLGKLEKETLLGAKFVKKLKKAHTYNNFVLNISDTSSLSETNQKLKHCGEYLCEINADDQFNFTYHPSRGLIAGSKNKSNSFLMINDSEVIISENLVKIIKVQGLPLGIVYKDTFYPAITNYKKELIGLMNESGSNILFVRNFSIWGEKEVLINPNLDSEQQVLAKILEKKSIWSFGQLLQNPLDSNSNFYWSSSRTYSAKARAWTSFDPNVAWDAKSLVGTHGNWNPYQYCGNDPVNFVDPSGYAIEANYISTSTDGGGVSLRAARQYNIENKSHDALSGESFSRLMADEVGNGALGWTGAGDIASAFLGREVTLNLSGQSNNSFKQLTPNQRSSALANGVFDFSLMAIGGILKGVSNAVKASMAGAKATKRAVMINRAAIGSFRVKDDIEDQARFRSGKAYGN